MIVCVSNIVLIKCPYSACLGMSIKSDNKIEDLKKEMNLVQVF